MDIKVGNIVRHKKTGVFEVVIDFCKVKVNGTWFDGIIYLGEDRNTGLPTKFCRTREEFEQEFEIILPNIKVTKGLEV
jgi:hypothetical protein